MLDDIEARAAGAVQSTPKWISSVVESSALAIVLLHFLPGWFDAASRLLSQQDSSDYVISINHELSAAWAKYPVAFPVVCVVMLTGSLRILSFQRKLRSLGTQLLSGLKAWLSRGSKLQVPFIAVILLIMAALENASSFMAESVTDTARGGAWLLLASFSGLISASVELIIDLLILVGNRPILSLILLAVFCLGAQTLINVSRKFGLLESLARRTWSLILRPTINLIVARVEIRRSLIYLLSYIAFPVAVGTVFSVSKSLVGFVASLNLVFLLLLVLLGFLVFKKLFGAKYTPPASKIVADDVSRLNSTEVDRIFYVRNANDVRRVILDARQEGKSVAVRGQSHTMGGHTIASGGYLIDTKFLNKISSDPQSKTVTTGPGATWADLIKHLNPLGLAPEIMQSYCSFSVGGTIAVNAHGITSDYGMIESVRSLRLIDAHGNDLECSRETNPELFRCVIGGFGLFGIVYEVTLRVVNNVKIGMEMIKVSNKDFESFYSQVLKDPSVEVKIARIEITSMDEIFLFLYRRTSDNPTISDLSDAPREMSTTSQFLYKWVLPIRAVQAFRFALETYTQTPMDWAGEHDRNLLLYESARPLAILYEPILRLNQTFILQEYFVPHSQFENWMKAVRDIILKSHDSMTLLNITIRYLYKDKESALPYAKEAMFAFVLYWRILRTPLVDQQLGHVHKQLIDITLGLGGTFYLPYRLVYTPEQLHRAYPEIDDFFKLKAKYDPDDVFSNSWYEKYRTTRPQARLPKLLSTQTVEYSAERQFTLPRVNESRSNSYKTLLATEEGRKRLRHFLLYVFHVENERSLYAKVLRATLRPENKDDLDVYQELQRVLSKRSIPVASSLVRAIRQFRQLRDQKREFIEEVLGMVSAAGYGGKIHNYASIGDSGKLVLPLRQSLGMQGETWVIHDKERPMDVIERGSLFNVGKFVKFDYTNVSDVPIRSNCVDLVTINMGLHHFPQDQLQMVLKMILRILRPGGLFLVREHDAEPSLIPMLDIAHSVFNVVTGVPFVEEKAEIRAFRPVEQWRSIITSAGFEDMQLYGLQATDPTEDYMMCFAKPPIHRPVSTQQQRSETTLPVPTTASPGRVKHNGVKSSAGSTYRLSEWLLVRVAEQYGNFLNHTPWYRFPYMSFLLISWKTFVNEFAVIASAHGLSEAFTNYGFMMNATILPVLSILFAQLAILSLPLLLLYGFSNGDTEYEEISLESPEQVDWQASVDSRIAVISVARLHDQGTLAYEIDIPRHGPFTAILKKIALTHPSVTLNSVSRQTELSVEMILQHEDQISWLRDQVGCVVNYSFRYPSDDSLHAACTVQVLSLFPLIRHCEAKGVVVAQCFDFLE